MGVRRYEINVEQHFTAGYQCKNWEFVWDDPECAALICELENNSIIKIAIPDDCDETCFWGTWRCLDDCDECDDVRFNVCVCETSADCDKCEVCIDNVCVYQCEPDQVCNDAGNCVDCEDNDDCPDGYICVNGKCVCPPDKPYVNDKGECVPCLDHTCPPGQICTKDGCVPIDCGEFYWSQEKEKCVECLNSGHCGENECCQPDNTCDCCPGFIRDYATGNCVPKPECETDDDCDECEYCSDGNCVETVCPPGEICVDDDCVEECDCAQPDCSSKSAACVSKDDDSDRCYCKECEGDCPDGCSEGCYCDEEKDECVPNPCSNIPCTDGTECGKGCGCNEDTGMCEPCSSADCGEECDNLLGCECPDGVNCQDVKGCDGPCDGFGDCAPGCTCVNGQCFPCSDFSCDNADCDNRPECECVNGNCEGDDDFCDDSFTNATEDCKVSASLLLKDGCMCPAVTAYMIPHRIVKSSSFSVQMEISIRLAKGFANGWANVAQLPILDDVSHPDIADNDTPESGTVTLKILEFYRPQVKQNNQWVDAGPITSREIALPGGNSWSLSNKARVDGITFKVRTPGKPQDYSPDGNSRNLIQRYELSTMFSTLKFPNNCKYAKSDLTKLVLSSSYTQVYTNLFDSGLSEYKDTEFYGSAGNYNLGGLFGRWRKLSSDDKRYPLFTWYRSEDDAYSKEDIIRKLYIKPDSPLTYNDGLYGPENFDPFKQNLNDPEGRVFGNMYYRVVNDCSCTERDLDFGNLVWCSPEMLELSNVIFTNCNKSAKIDSDIGRPCDVNRFLGEMDLHPDDNTPAFRKKHQAKYVLTFTLENGTTEVTEYVWRDSNVSSPGLYRLLPDGNVSPNALKGSTHTFGEQITGVKLELKYGDSDEVICDWKGKVPEAKERIPIYTKDCSAINDRIRWIFSKNLNNIDKIEATGGTVVPGDTPDKIDVRAKKGDLVKIIITYTDGSCPWEGELQDDCCGELSGSILRTTIGDTVQLSVRNITGGVKPMKVEYFRRRQTGDDELVADSTDETRSYGVSLVLPEDGFYYAIITDAIGCKFETERVSISIIDPDNFNLNLSPELNGCFYTGNAIVGLTSEPTLIDAKVYYRINSGAEQYFTVTPTIFNQGQYKIPAQGDTVELIRVVVPVLDAADTEYAQDDSISIPQDLAENVPGVTSMQVNGSDNSTTVCEGQQVELDVMGTAFARVQFDNISELQLDGSGNGSRTLTPNQSTNIRIIGVTNSNGECPGTQGVGFTRSVNVVNNPVVEVLTNDCDGQMMNRTITFNNVTRVEDQNGNTLPLAGNAVTVNPRNVTSVVAYYNNGTCETMLVVPIAICECPDITADIVAPAAVCDGASFSLDVLNVQGGTAPYSYNIYAASNYNENYYLPNSRTFSPTGTETYHVRIQDANGCISVIGSVQVQVNVTPDVNIQPITGQQGWMPHPTANSHIQVYDNVNEITFQAVPLPDNDHPISLHEWRVTNYTGNTQQNIDPTFAMTVADIDPAGAVLTVIVTDTAGCTNSISITVSVIPAPSIITDDEILLVMTGNRVYKAKMLPAIEPVVEVCPANSPVYNIVMTGNNALIGGTSGQLYEIDTDAGCNGTLIGPYPDQSVGLGMLNGHTIVSLKGRNVFNTYDLNTNTVTNPWYTITHPTYEYSLTGDVSRAKNVLYASVAKTEKSTGAYIGDVLIGLTLDGADNVVAFNEIVDIPTSILGLATLHDELYLIKNTGEVYKLDTATNTIPLHGNIVRPTINGVRLVINDATNNA